MSNQVNNIADLQFAQYNPRKISDHDFQKLQQSINKFGDLSCIVRNVRTNNLVGGHQRVKAMMQQGQGVIDYLQTYEMPTATGTVSRGTITINGEAFAYREVDWSESFEKAANIAANRIQGEFDDDLLASLVKELNEFNPELLDLTGQMTDEINALLNGTPEEEKPEDYYTKEITAPTYEPKNEKPSIASLVTHDRTKTLLAEIDNADVDEDTKAFLRLAANRHNVFDYSKIADFYAHSSPEIQNLMENSALVIIDYNKAVENGYVKLTKDMMEVQGEDYPDEE